MGYCSSGEEEAKQTELPPPAFGQDPKVKPKKKKGWFDDADLSGLDGEGAVVLAVVGIAVVVIAETVRLALRAFCSWRRRRRRALSVSAAAPGYSADS